MNNNNNKILIILVIILSILVLALGGYLFYDKILSTNDINGDNDNNKQNTDINEINKFYKFGEQITISKLSSVTDYYLDITEDFSKWNVLFEDDEYVTLLSQKTFGKVEPTYLFNDINIFNEYDVSLGPKGEIRGLSCQDLELFGCDLNKLTCSNKPEWAGYTLTNCSSANQTRIIFTGSDLPFEYNSDLETINIYETALVYYKPVIKILKSNIK